MYTITQRGMAAHVRTCLSSSPVKLPPTCVHVGGIRMHTYILAAGIYGARKPIQDLAGRTPTPTVERHTQAQ